MRLIDADKINFLLAPIAPVYISDDVHYEQVALKRGIDIQPTIDIVPVVHAHWIGSEMKNGVYRGRIVLCDRNGYVHVTGEPCLCSNCKGALAGSDEYAVKGRYCPNCGAKMDEEKPDEEKPDDDE